MVRSSFPVLSCPLLASFFKLSQFSLLSRSLSSRYFSSTMPRNARLCIVDPNFILDHAEMRGEKWTLFDLGGLFKPNGNVDREAIIKWLARRGLIRNSCTCTQCNVQMSFVRRSDISDGFSWRCSTCLTRKTIRTGS